MRFSYLSIEFPALEVLRGKAITSIRANFSVRRVGAPRTQQSDRRRKNRSKDLAGAFSARETARNSFSSRLDSEFVCWKRSDYDSKFRKS